MSFVFYDLAFLFMFAVFVSVFLYRGRKNLSKEGLLLLYKTSWGIKLIHHVGKKYKKTLKILSYVSVATGYLLMTVVIYYTAKIVYVYVTLPSIVREIKVPPITPLIPYLPQVFNIDFLPPFYFTYWIIIIAIIAVTHEFAHGIFAAYDKVRIKTTGFGFFPFFLPIFLAAFVEPDEKNMEKKSKFSQLTVLSAGTFANILTAILFFAILWIFFVNAFVPSGVIYNDYAYSVFPLSGISMINGIPLENPNYSEVNALVNGTKTDIIEINDKIYDKGIKGFAQNNEGDYFIKLYEDAPAINAHLERVILKFNGVETTSVEKLGEEISKHSPGEKITLTLLSSDGEDNYNRDIVLEEKPDDSGEAWLGIGFVSQTREGIIGKVYMVLSSFKDPNVYYVPKFDGISVFTYNLLWWIVIISLSVALVNMLPVGIFDGGRFFYLTIWALTGKEKFAKKSFAFSTYLILFLILVLMFFWLKIFF